jgi:hypothetical protein
VANLKYKGNSKKQRSNIEQAKLLIEMFEIKGRDSNKTTNSNRNEIISDLLNGLEPCLNFQESDICLLIEILRDILEVHLSGEPEANFVVKSSFLTQNISETRNY